MPELPEVETVRRGLEPAILDRTIMCATINRPDLRWPFPKDMRARLEGQRITHVGRRSKYLLIALDGGETLLVHLGMSGRVLIEQKQLGKFHHETDRLANHDHVVLDFNDETRVVYNDARRFGAMDLIASGQIDAHPLLAKLGPEPLSNAMNAAYLAQALSGKTSPIKSVLLDQRVIAGLGNIYVCEALWRAGISPRRKAKNIAAKRIEPLVDAIRAVIRDAIDAGGSSLRDYRQTNGELGYFQHNFATYDQEGAACKTADCPGNIARIVQSGRSSFYCPQCQR
jgi:formamidopyrimidine-DNA glycosylase